MTGIYLDIGALFEDRWTGIPNVVAAVATAALADDSLSWIFFFETIEVPRSLVRQLLYARSGTGGLRSIEDLAWHGRMLDPDDASRGIGIYTNVKTMRRFFRREAMIIYDLSPVIAPKFHNEDNVLHFANRIRQDIASSDHLFCISRATMMDVYTYFAKPVEQMSVVRLGVDINRADISSGDLRLRGLSPEPYVVIVGTVEPRKNGRIMFDYLMRDPAFADRYRIVFVGREGWLAERERLFSMAIASGVAHDRILFTGYLSDADKTALMLNARFCIYPSFFEGFGLPVLESSVLGRMTVCSNSSSLPEVDSASSIFFDPDDLDEFGRALRVAEATVAHRRAGNDAFDEILARREAAGWASCYRVIGDWVREA